MTQGAEHTALVAFTVCQKLLCTAGGAVPSWFVPVKCPRPLNGSSLLVGLAETTGDDVIKDWFKQLLSLRIQELRESRGGHPGLPVPNSPCGLCGHKATLNLNSYIC